MDGALPLGANGGNDNRGQGHRKTTSGCGGPAGLTFVTNPLQNLHLRTDQMGRRVRIRSRRAILSRRPRLGDDRQRCQPRLHDTCEMRNKQHRVNEQTRAAVRHRTDVVGAVHAETWPYETPLAENDSNDKSLLQDHTIQHTGDTLARPLDGRTPNLSGAAQPMNEEGHGSRG